MDFLAYGNKNEGVPIFLVEMDKFDLVEGDDVHDPTTSIQGWCALATDTPTPRIAAFLWCATWPRGHSSCKQSKNKQEHNEQSQLQNIYIELSIWNHKMVGFRLQSDGRFIQHVRWKAVANG